MAIPLPALSIHVMRMMGLFRVILNGAIIKEESHARRNTQGCTEGREAVQGKPVHQSLDAGHLAWLPARLAHLGHPHRPARLRNAAGTLLESRFLNPDGVAALAPSPQVHEQEEDMNDPDLATKWEGQRCKSCGRPILPTGIYGMAIDGFCECIFWR